MILFESIVSFTLSGEDIEVRGSAALILRLDSHLNGSIFIVSLVLSLLRSIAVLLAPVGLLVGEGLPADPIGLKSEPESLLHDSEQVLNSLVLLVVHEVVRLVLVHDPTMHLFIELIKVDLLFGVVNVNRLVVEVLQGVDPLGLIHGLEIGNLLGQHLLMDLDELQNSVPGGLDVSV